MVLFHPRRPITRFEDYHDRYTAPIVFGLLVIIGCLVWFLVASADTPPEQEFPYKEGTEVELYIKQVKEELTKRLEEQGCKEARFEIWREDETVFIAVYCLEP